MKKAVAYCRYSSDNQREESIEAQLREIRKFAEREGYTIIKVYADEARSALTDNRPQFQQMIADAATGLFEYIIVHKLDRFSRDRYDSAFYKRELKRYGVRLISVLERLSDDPESIILESVLEGMAEYYSRNLAREVMKGMRETAYQCKHTGGVPPLGYDVAPDRSYTVNPREAEAVRLIFTMYESGSGYSEILDALKTNGFNTKTGKDFGKNSLHDILVNEKYAGIYVFNKTERKIAGKRNGHRIKDDEEIIRVQGGIPAIISSYTWERARERMEKNKRTQASYRAKTTYLLSGLIYCGSCGGAMLGKHGRTGRNKTDYAYYECGTRKRTRNCDMKPINKDHVEKLVIDTLYENVFSPFGSKNAAQLIFDYAQKQMSDIPDYVKSCKKELDAVNREIANMVDAISKGMYHESMKAKMDDLESKKGALILRISEAEHQTDVHSLSLEQIHGYLGRYSCLHDMPPADQKQAIEMFVTRVTVYDEYVDVDIRPWFVPPDKDDREKREEVDLHQSPENTRGVGTQHDAVRLHQLSAYI